ncbi:MAG: hypothetical protein LC803_22175 [Acidobacteria bacterium]|nr:hypothetical protein [Acidobacteriota bacterium]
MAENPPQKSSRPVIERKCRVVFDVNIRISEITPENVADTFTPDETGEGLPWEWAERQNRLLLALLQDEEALEQFLTSITTSDFGSLLESDHISGMPDEEEGALFAKLLARMSKDDCVFFQEALKEGVLFDNIVLVHRAFVADWKRAEVKDVRAIKPEEA